MITLVKAFAERKPKEFIAMSERFHKYHKILINKPSYNEDDIKLWFEFAKECKDNWMFALYSVQVIVDSLMTTNPIGRYIIFPTTTNYRGEDNYVAFAYVDKHYQGMDWQLQEMGIDSLSWSILIKDTESDRIFKYPIDNLSSMALLTLIANLRKIDSEKLDIRREIIITKKFG